MNKRIVFLSTQETHEISKAIHAFEEKTGAAYIHGPHYKDGNTFDMEWLSTDKDYLALQGNALHYTKEWVEIVLNTVDWQDHKPFDHGMVSHILQRLQEQHPHYKAL